MLFAFLAASLLVFLAAAYLAAPAWVWTAALGAFVAGCAWLAPLAAWATAALAVAFVAFAALAHLAPLRRKLLSDPVLRAFRKVMPAMSQTEAEAINAGTVWWDGDLFSGQPDWAKLLSFPKPELAPEEQAFLDNETEELCRIANDWETYALGDMPPHVWQYIKDKGFLGMIIPKAYGGKGFSAYAHSQVIMKLSTRCGAAAVSVMVPNSLGPAELLLHYGTDRKSVV